MASLGSSRKQDGEGVVHLEGELTDESSSDELEEWLEEHFVDDGVRTIRLDLSAVTFIDLEGAAALGVLAAEAMRQRKVFIVEGVSGQVRTRLEQTGLLGYLERPQSPGTP